MFLSNKGKQQLLLKVNSKTKLNQGFFKELLESILLNSIEAHSPTPAMKPELCVTYSPTSRHGRGHTEEACSLVVQGCFPSKPVRVGWHLALSVKTETPTMLHGVSGGVNPSPP